MSNELKIDQAKTSDYYAIAVLLQETQLPPDGIEAHLENFLIIRKSETTAKSEKIVGSVGLEIYGKSALLRSLAVHPDYQGQGLGTRLVNKIIDFAKDRGITRIFLLTDTAEDYFTRKGFVIVTRDKVPEDMKQSIEFTTLCTSAPSMMRDIS
ncbi:MAG: arsenic resistance N-acetyltransferase ArsN2 [Candidatus Sifarchaeia archaeon]